MEHTNTPRGENMDFWMSNLLVYIRTTKLEIVKMCLNDFYGTFQIGKQSDIFPTQSGLNEG